MNKLKELLFVQNSKDCGPVFINENKDEIAKCQGYKDVADLIEEKKGVVYQNFSGVVEAVDQYVEELSIMDDVRVFTIFDKDYPVKANDLGKKKSPILYVKGNVNLFKQPSIAVVGTRKPCEQAIKFETALLEKSPELMNNVIVSGLALGCDRIAHETTLKLKKQTMAVLPCGIDKVSPPSHKDLAQQILEEGGCLVSSFMVGLDTKNYMFVERDSLIAALSDAILVVECGVKSGTMHTIDAGKKMNRPLGCYKPTMKNYGDFSGNDLVIAEKGGVQISSQEGLNKFLSLINTRKQSKIPEVQLSLL